MLRWYDTIDGVLIFIGFRPTQSDPCVYTHGSADTLVILTLYVDEIFISGQDAALVAQRRKELQDRFEMKGTGEVSLILGIEVRRGYDEGTLTHHHTEKLRQQHPREVRNAGDFTLSANLDMDRSFQSNSPQTNLDPRGRSYSSPSQAACSTSPSAHDTARAKPTDQGMQ